MEKVLTDRQEKEKMIENYIHAMPQNGCCDDDFLKRFFIR